ncbi:gamma-butyrobetaine hydroxylase-like domain-containing protein [Chelatococcus sp. GCM10030263]|uniref:gamma-butyrobetaine hydroxylase-like domain-containing protein n=1 Tax=Chelatococcus sp. GCM10030263 TaxID=3273387 RepID=UPI00361502BA
MATVHWPSELRLSADKRVFTVSFESGELFSLRAEYLRVMSPSAEVRGHSPSERKTVAGKKDVTIAAVEPVGRYAVRLVFSDGHDTGLFTWDYLHELGATEAETWAAYLTELKDKGLSRG